MYIKINKDNKVTFCSTANLTANNEDIFLVDSIPPRERGRHLCFNPETREFYQKEIEGFVEEQNQFEIQKELNSLEEEEKAALFEAMKIIVENYQSDRPEWQEWSRKRSERKNRREELIRKRGV